MKTILLILFIIFSTEISSQPIWNYQNSGTTNDLNRIIIRTSNSIQTLFVVGDNGTILKSSNFGLIWEKVNSNTNSNLYSIVIGTNDTGYAVGSNGTIIRTTDGGNSWAGMTSNTNNTLKEVIIRPISARVFCVGENGTFLKLENNVWEVSQIDTTDLNSVSYQGVVRIIAVGNNGLILKSDNNGTDWQQIISHTSSNLNNISQNTYVIGDNGTALSIYNTDVTIINTATVNNLYGQFNLGGSFRACGANGTILQNWQNTVSNTNLNLNSIIASSTNYQNSFITGDSGVIIFTNNVQPILNVKQLNANNINTWYRSNGSFNRNPYTDNAGFEWPKYSAKFARYASGLWLGAKVGNDTLVAIAEYSYEYLPGYIDNAGIPQGNTDPLYRIYSIIRDDTTSADYLNWPANQGAYMNSQGKPFFLGTQTMFYSHTDGYTSSHTNRAGRTAPLKAVILQTNWSYTNVNMQDVAFTEYKIINKNNLPWTDAYIGIWTDDDLGGFSDDAVGCDTNLSLGYTCNADNVDDIYGAAPPAVGFLILRGPVAASPGDTAKYYDPPGSNNLVIKPNYKEKGLTSYCFYTGGLAGASDPANYHETYNNLRGIRANGTLWINIVTGQQTLFPYSGDPETGTGWVMLQGSDRRSLMGIGPLNINPGDTQSVIIAQLIIRGSNNLNSVTKLKELSNYVKGVYDNNFQGVLSVSENLIEIPDQYKLSQNYPNPFNPTTNLEFGISNLGFVTLKVYDLLGKEVAVLVNENKPAGNYSVTFNGSNLSSGVYFYSLFVNGNPVDTKRMLLLK